MRGCDCAVGGGADGGISQEAGRAGRDGKPATCLMFAPPPHPPTHPFPPSLASPNTYCSVFTDFRQLPSAIASCVFLRHPIFQDPWALFMERLGLSAKTMRSRYRAHSLRSGSCIRRAASAAGTTSPGTSPASAPSPSRTRSAEHGSCFPAAAGRRAAVSLSPSSRCSDARPYGFTRPRGANSCPPQGSTLNPAGQP